MHKMYYIFCSANGNEILFYSVSYINIMCVTCRHAETNIPDTKRTCSLVCNVICIHKGRVNVHVVTIHVSTSFQRNDKIEVVPS